jgi:Ca2+-binding RTX toxin-like protein
MTTSSLLVSVYDQLTDFANLSNFWSLFDTAFGSSYDFATAASFRSQWQGGDFSLFPQIEVVSSDVLGSAKGAYAISTNRIYLSDAFISSASQQSLDAVILEEYGHFVDAQVNATDTAGDEGELFSAIVRGVSLSAAELSRIKTEDDHAVVMIEGQAVAVEQSVTQVGVWDRLGHANAVTVVGNYAYAVGDTLLEIIDISNPSNPLFKGNYDNYDTNYGQGIGQGIQVLGNYAYVADGDSGLQIINISNPAAPTLAGTYDTTGVARGVQVLGNYAYVADWDSGLQIINISNPAAPTLTGSYDTTGVAYRVQVVGNYAYVADEDSGLQIIDISNPAAPTLTGTYDTTGDAIGVQVVGNYAYVADWFSLQIINISNPAAPTLTASYDTPGVGESFTYGVQVVGNYAYVADTYSGLQIINISNPAAPTLTGSYDTTGFAREVQVLGNYAYVADAYSGLQIINISNPAAPTFTASYDTGYAWRVQVVGNYAYVADGGSGLQIINISNPASPTLTGSYTGYANDVQVVGNYAYVAEFYSGLQIINISNPAAPTLTGTYDTPDSAQGIQVVGNYAYVADYASGLQIINISNPAAPTLTGTYDTTYIAYGVQVVGNYAYVADGSSGLQIIDISNPAAPTLTGTYDTPDSAQGIQVVGNYAYVADGSSGLQIIDISNPAAPTLAGTYDTPGYAQEVQVVGNYAYVADGGLQIIDISNPAAPTLAETYDTTGSAQGVQVVGNYAYVADYDGGLKILDVSDFTPATVNLAVAPASVTEDGTSNLVYTFTRTGSTTSTLTVNYSITGTADATDYTGATPGTGKTITFAANSTIATLTIDPTADTTIEANETVALTLATGTGYAIGTTTAVTGTITNDDFPSITLAVAPTSVTEDGTTNLVYTFTRTGPTTSTLAINYGITGTADATDYTGATPGTGKTITFAANSATATLTIDPTADTTIESNDTVALTLATGTGYTVGTTAAVTGTITNDDLPSITLAVAPTSVTEDGTTNLVYTFTRTGPTTSTLTVNYGITGTADATDYTGTTPGTGKTITFAANSATATLTIDPTADTLFENNETVALTLATGTGYTVGTTTAVTGTITNDDLPSITLAVAPTSVNEDGTTNLVYTFTRTGPTTSALTVNYGITGTADATDYTGATPGTGKTITFAANSATATLTIDPTADTTIESNETIALTLATGTGYTVGTTAAVTGTITNDDLPSITLAVAPTSVNEDGTTNLVYTFTRTGPTTSALTVNYGITGTADATDYTGATPGTGKTITFAANSTIATLTIDPTADTTIEANETVALTLATGTGYTVGTTTAVTGTITNDDLPSITLAVAPTSINEDGTTNLVYTFTRTGPTTSPLTVNYGITGTADATDYTGATPGTGKTITFAANSATATLTIDPTADTTIESDETVALTLATGTGYTVGTTAAVTGTITNDDFPSITLAVAPASVLEDGTPNLVYTFTRTGATTNALTVNYSIAGTADTTDYTGATLGTGKTINFLAGSATATLTINPTADTTIEANETVALTLATGAGYTVGTTTAVTGTITNDDFPSITLAVAPASVLEDGTPNLVYTFTRTGPTSNALTVNYSIGGTATNGTDYTTIVTSVTFAAGSTTATVTVDPTADTIIEDNETVALTLATGTGYTIGTTTAVTGTITNDDFPSISINDITVVEGKDLTAPLTLSLSSPSPQTITVNYTITAVDATANLDYTSSTGTLTFAANSTTATLSIPILNDNLNEEDESFFITLSNPNNATLNPDANIGEVIITDTLQSSLTRTLTANVENLKLIGTAAINGTGNAGNNVLTGNSGNNTLTGLEGNDTYSFLANTLLGTDTITETTTGGIDTLNFSGTNNQVRLNLGSITNQTVVTGNLILKLSAVDVIENVIGGNSGDRLTGNSLNNSLDGSGGNDNLSGGNGADTLTGGIGDDLLTGGAGNDNFAYVTGKTFTTSDIGLDTLTDFTPTADKLLLSKTTFAALTSIVGNGFSQATDFAVVEDDFLVETSNAFIVYSSNSGSLFYNQNGNAAGLGTGAEFAVLISNPILTSNDFTLIA